MYACYKSEINNTGGNIYGFGIRSLRKATITNFKNSTMDIISTICVMCGFIVIIRVLSIPNRFRHLSRNINIYNYRNNRNRNVNSHCSDVNVLPQWIVMLMK